jgi:hypothetical protein
VVIDTVLNTKIILLIILLLTGNVFWGFAQSKKQERKIIITIDSHDAKAVIENIQKDNNIKFSYSDNILDGVKISVKANQEISLKKFLDTYLISAGIGYIVLGDQIVLFLINKKNSCVTISGYIKDAVSSEDVIGATIFNNDLLIGTITNSYGFFSLKIPKGNHKLTFGCLGYYDTIVYVTASLNRTLNIQLKPKLYRVSQVNVLSKRNAVFLESSLMNMIKVDIKSLQELPELFGENDAIRNLSALPGIQANELSTSNLNVRGGGSGQTVFLMDEATLYNASHFGGFFSIVNPDVVNNVEVYKSDIPVKEGGALSSLINVNLREGNNQKMKIKGGIGVISARISVEGPVVKDKSSILFAFRRSYIDNLMRVLMTDPDLKNITFYFYDTNLKWNYKLNGKNRFFISGYAGSDLFTQYLKLQRMNYLASARWNHLFNSHFFSNTTFTASNNIMRQGTLEGKDLLYWQSKIFDYRLKTDFTYYYSSNINLNFGYSGVIYNIYPFSLLTQTENSLITRYESLSDRLMLNSIYYKQSFLIKKKLSIDAGFRLTYMVTNPFSDSVLILEDLYWEPQIRISYALTPDKTVKLGYSRQKQPLHQLPVSSMGISINRWMPANRDFIPQISDNFTAGYYDNNLFGIKMSAEVYFREMNNLIETLQDKRILYTDKPDFYLHKTSGYVYGAELSLSYNIKNFKSIVSYSYSNPMVKTEGLNEEKYYPASHTRKHMLNVSGVYYFSKRVKMSATWVFATGLPYTAPTGKYVLNGKTYLQFDDDKVNTKLLPPYHRLDLSIDVESKKNKNRRWKSFWNFSVYNVYFRKNPLGVYYFIPETQGGETVQKFNPGFYYLYQIVPSVSYRFEF